MDLLDKVRLIIGNKCDSPSQFADEIDIPRSAVSHLLNGRNRPSLDVIKKIISRYPDIGTEWIWDEEKMPALNAGLTTSETIGKPVSKTQNQPTGRPLDLFSQPEAVPSSIQQNLRANEIPENEKKLVRILFFYEDGTFSEYKPA